MLSVIDKINTVNTMAHRCDNCHSNRQWLRISAAEKAEAVADRKWTSFPAGEFPIHVSK